MGLMPADFSAALRRAIALARTAGLRESTDELESRAFATYTTSSELLGETGDAILQFRKREGARVPDDVSDLLDQCLWEIGKAWPKYRLSLLRSLARRIRRLLGRLGFARSSRRRPGPT